MNECKQTGISAVPPGHFNNFTAMRLVLAALVIYMHAFCLTKRMSLEPLYQASHGEVDFGWLAVNIFLAFSGYLVAESLMRSASINDYLIKRVLRIYPGFVCALLVSVLIFLPLGGCQLHTLLTSREPLQFIYRPLAMRGVWMHLPGFCVTNPLPFQLNASIWTIRFEVFFYFLLAAMFAGGALKRKRILSVAFVVLLCSFGGRAIVCDVPYFGEIGALTRLLPYFLAGVLVYVWRDRLSFNWIAASLSAAALCCALATGTAQLIFPIAGVYLAFYLAYNQFLFQFNPLRKIDLSYGVYLYGFPIEQLLVYRVDFLRTHVMLLFVASLVVSLCFASLSWFWVEKPFLRMKARLSERAPTSPPMDTVPLPVNDTAASSA